MTNTALSEVFACNRIGKIEVQVVIGNIAYQHDVDVIVNTTNPGLQAGSGVSASVFGAAGHKQLMEACAKLSPIQIGDAVITPAFQLPNGGIIHCCGPRYEEFSNPAAILVKTYENIFRVVLENEFSSLAIPAISTGANGYPAEEAAQISIRSVEQFSLEISSVTLIRFVVADVAMASCFAHHLMSVYPPSEGAVSMDLDISMSEVHFHRISGGRVGDMDAKWSMLYKAPWFYIWRGGSWMIGEKGVTPDFCLKVEECAHEYRLVECSRTRRFEDIFDDDRIKEVILFVLSMPSIEEVLCRIERPWIVLDSGDASICLNSFEARKLGRKLFVAADVLDHSIAKNNVNRPGFRGGSKS